MELITKIIKKFKKPGRMPATAGNLVALTGAILIVTNDGNVFITTQLARDLAKNMPKIADQAEKAGEVQANV